MINSALTQTMGRRVPIRPAFPVARPRLLRGQHRTCHPWVCDVATLRRAKRLKSASISADVLAYNFCHERVGGSVASRLVYGGFPEAQGGSFKLQNRRTRPFPLGYPAMARIFFAASIQRHIATPEREIDAHTLGEALEAVFAAQPRLRGYIVDDQGSLRRHLSVFVDGRPVRDRQRLSDALGEESRVYVIQALSGG
jgi:molybdopterin synthase sulfur carrier subunit